MFAWYAKMVQFITIFLFILNTSFAAHLICI